MNLTKALFASLLAVLLAACGDKASDPAQEAVIAAPAADRVTFYVEHDAERKAKLAECTSRGINRMADTEEAAECRAAGKAADHALLKPATASEPKQYKKF